MIRCTVVICTHRHGTDLLDALASALRGARPDEVLLVRSEVLDGEAPPAHLEAWLRHHPEVRTTCEPSPGASPARARGLREATGDVVLFLDDDVVAEPGWYDAMTAAFADPDVAAAGGSIEADFPTGRPSWLPTSLDTYYGIRPAGRTRHRPFGANMGVRRSAALDVGGFPSGLGHVGDTPGLHEETELVERLLAAGHRLAEVPSSRVRHRVRSDQVSRRWVLRRAWHEGRSDADRDRARSVGDPLVRLLKAAALTAVLPLALLHPRHGVHVAARLAVNLGYLKRWISSRGSTAADVPPRRLER